MRQIREYRHYPGLVALDLSDILPATSGVRDVALAARQNLAAFRAGYANASAYVTRRQQDKGYSRLGVLFCFAESFLWTSPTPLPLSGVLFYGEVFHGASAGLIVDQSQKLRDGTLKGFEELGGIVRRITRVT